MVTEVRIPSIGFSTKEATLMEWLVADGDTVKEGQPLYTLELDKSVQEIEAPAAGKVMLMGEPGTVYQIGDKIADID